MSKRMIVIAVATLSLAICDGANGEVINFFAPSAPSGPSMPGISPADVLSILNSAGSRAYDRDADGWADTAPGQGCNPMGYVVLHPSNWRLNVHLFFFNWSQGYPPFWVGVGGGGNGGGGNGGGGYGWPWDFPPGFDPDDFESYFGSSEDPNPGNPGDFGVGEDGTVPEPASLLLLTAGAAGVILKKRGDARKRDIP